MTDRAAAFKQWWALSIHNATLPETRESLAREAYYAAWGGGAEIEHWQRIASQGIATERELRIEMERLRAERDELFRANGELAHIAVENERLRGLLDDKQYIQIKADYNRGHLSHHGWLKAVEQKND